MSREQAMMHMLDAAAKLQRNVALILEAKALEAEKARNWTINHVMAHTFETHEDQLQKPLEIHEQMVEMLEGLTRLQTGLCSNLKAVLEEESADGLDGMFGDSFGDGDSDS
ncbi:MULTISPECIES: hypothetical protein [Paenibacillus]|uniref:hypothetical protein n=1 Tax=Paenibacillus TaxID=44249 RepID=UPI00037F1829|nr:hypothetical protein [Paenibacillus massiliensis]